MKANYNFQLTASKTTYEMSVSDRYHAVVLAAAPNAGKSTMVIDIINRFAAEFASYKIIVLTHNQKLLTNQMIETFEEGFVVPEFTYGTFDDDTQVQVGIPSSRSKITACDVLIVDEAHQYYDAAMVQEIIAKFKPKHQILMTGTPGCFNAVNQSKGYNYYGIYYISGQELAEKDVYSDVVVDVVESNDGVVANYNAAMKRLKTDARFSDSKLMIACKTTADAYELGIYLRANGRKIAISTGENDSSNIQVDRFKKGEADALIVVNKGILGFSDNMITALIDLKSSKDIDARFQLFARIFRKHPMGVKKFYISAASAKNMNKEIQVIRDAVALMDRKTFIQYT